MGEQIRIVLSISHFHVKPLKRAEFRLYSMINILHWNIKWFIVLYNADYFLSGTLRQLDWDQ